jgi:hypothetical protein
MVTPEMLDAGKDVIQSTVGGADFGGNFSAADLAEAVYTAMHKVRLNALDKIVAAGQEAGWYD